MSCSRDALLRLGAALREARANGQGTDLILRCAGGDVCAHKVVATSISPVLKAALGGAFREATTCVVELPDVQCAALEFMLDFCCGSAKKIDGENALELLVLSDRLQVEPLRQACAVALSSILVTSNAATIASKAAECGCPELAAHAERLVGGGSAALQDLATRKRVLEAAADAADAGIKRAKEEAKAARRRLHEVSEKHDAECELAFRDLHARAAPTSDGDCATSAYPFAEGRTLRVRSNECGAGFCGELPWGEYPSVMDAVAAADPGDVLVLYGGKHVLDDQRKSSLGAFAKSVTLRADAGLGPDDVCIAGPVMGDNAGLIVVFEGAQLRLVNLSVTPDADVDICRRSLAVEVVCSKDGTGSGLWLEGCRLTGGVHVYANSSAHIVDSKLVGAEGANVLISPLARTVSVRRCLVTGAGRGSAEPESGTTSRYPFLAGDCGAIEVRADHHLCSGSEIAVRVEVTGCAIEGNHGPGVSYRIDPAQDYIDMDEQQGDMFAEGSTYVGHRERRTDYGPGPNLASWCHPIPSKMYAALEAAFTLQENVVRGNSLSLQGVPKCAELRGEGGHHKGGPPDEERARRASLEVSGKPTFHAVRRGTGRT